VKTSANGDTYTGLRDNRCAEKSELICEAQPGATHRPANDTFNMIQSDNRKNEEIKCKNNNYMQAKDKGIFLKYNLGYKCLQRCLTGRWTTRNQLF
jgi:hypothetical protein